MYEGAAMTSIDYYRTMEIHQTASGDDIKYAYRRLAKRFHPDVSTDPDSERQFKAVGEAYRTLKRPELRAAYDRQSPTACRHDDAAFMSASLQIWFAALLYPNWLHFWGVWTPPS
jgi:DnaJ-class molecular chaperone